jgi:hypothetical protein
MKEVKNAMMSAHGRSFFLYSNGIVSPMKAMFVHEIDISGFVRWTSVWIVITKDKLDNVIEIDRNRQVLFDYNA